MSPYCRLLTASARSWCGVVFFLFGGKIPSAVVILVVWRSSMKAKKCSLAHFHISLAASGTLLLCILTPMSTSASEIGPLPTLYTTCPQQRVHVNDKHLARRANKTQSLHGLFLTLHDFTSLAFYNIITIKGNQRIIATSCEFRIPVYLAK